jgi:Ni2+-binding GTPase involved in maturation of urease and hydrogenase
MKENGKMINKQDMVDYIGQMVHIMKDRFKMEKDMDLEN